jgi:hypothetical protein
MKVKFTKQGAVVVSSNGWNVVVGSASNKSTASNNTKNYWVLSSYANTDTTRLQAFYGERRKDLIPFAISIFYEITRDVEDEPYGALAPASTPRDDIFP